MKIIGLHTGHNSSACLLVDGELVAALQEERPTRIKNYAGFPTMAIQYLLKYANLTLDDIDRFAYTDIYRIVPDIYTKRSAAEAHFSKPPGRMSYSNLRDQLQNFSAFADGADALRVRRRVNELNKYKLPKDKLVRVDHHLAHASATYYGWGKYDAPVLVLTCDGAGDGLCATVSIGDSGQLRRIAAVPAPHSIGLIYTMVTLMLGMKPNEHEYKLMGMAPYAHLEDSLKVVKKFERYFQQDSHNFLGWKTTKALKDTYWSYQTLRKDLEFERFDVICAALQIWLEDFLVDWVRRCILHTGISRVALSGGVFMNVKANKRIMDLEEVSELFIFPSCGDETNPMGSSYHIYSLDHGIGDIKPLSTFYLGPEYSNAEIEKALSAADDLHVSRPQNISRAVAKLLSEGEVVARFSGREEFGARALGNRSILANPSKPEVIKTINEMIKNRDFWMPFACSIKADRAEDYIVNPKNISASYMILTFDTTGRRREIFAGTHPYDGTARPQVVDHLQNPAYFELLAEFESFTGIGGVLNTSLNLHGYPIVHTPEDALQVLLKSGLKYLSLGPFLISKAH